MSHFNRILYACLALGLVAFVSSCEKDSLAGEDLGPTVVERDGHIPEVLCQDICEDEAFINFNERPADQPFNVTNNGVDVWAQRPNGDPAEVWVFDTDRTVQEAKQCPDFNDTDLLFPGGPFGNVLVIQEEDVTTCANDAQRGGVVTIDFSRIGTVSIFCMEFFDTEEQGLIDGFPVSGLVALYDETDQLLGEYQIPGVEDGGATVLPINESSVAYMTVILLGSGALSDICLAVDDPVCKAENELLDFEDLEENVPVTSVGGVMVDAYPTPAIAFDTENPTMCPDFDDDDMIITPPLGEGFPADYTLGKLLVNQHQTKTGCANADPRGGTIAFTFPTLVSVSSMGFVDTEEGGWITFYGVGDTYITTLPIPITEDGGWEFLFMAGTVPNVAKMVVDFNGSGGIDQICYEDSGVQYPPLQFAGCTQPKQWWRYNLDMVCELVDLEEENGCGLTIPEVLSTKIKGNSYRLLNKEYVTAFLNVACKGAPFDEYIADTWTAAGQILTNCDQEIPMEAMPILLQLQHFNEGIVGPGSCSDGEPG